MKNERTDLNRLLGGLLLFCVVSALFYVQNEKNPSENTPNTTIEAVQTQSPTSPEFTPQELLNHMTILIESHDIKAIANALVEIPHSQIRAVIKAIISDPKIGLAAQEKLNLILAVAQNYIQDPNTHVTLFNIFTEHPELFKDFSFIYFAAAHGYSGLIPILEKWAQEKKATMQDLSEFTANAVYKGMRTAIEHNNIGALKNIFEQKVTISPEQATELLWLAVSQAQDPAFVQLLVAHGANINAAKDGYSLLAKAVTTKNLNLVQAVAQADPQPNINAMHNPEIGTALQLAIQNGLTDIDEYLRSQGARE